MTRRPARLLLSSAFSLGLAAGAFAQLAHAQEAEEEKSEQVSGANGLAGTENALEQLLKEALDEGYVTLKSDATEAPQQLTPEPAHDTPADKPEAVSPRPVPAYRDIGTILEDNGYTAETADIAPQPAPVPVTRSASCQDSDLFVFSERSYSWDDVMRLQATVQGGAAEPGLEGMIRLAKQYLAIGFAEEAIALMRPYASEDRAQTIIYMGEAVLGRISDSNELKLPESVCSRYAGLWRAVTLIEAQPTTALFLAGASADELEKLPVHLRTDFSARLGILAAESGQWALARTLYEVAAHDGAHENKPLIYLKALISAEAGVDRDVAINTIERIAQEDGPLQVKAILMLGKLEPEEEGEFYPGFYRDLENVAVRTDGNPQSFPEAFMEVRLAAETGNFLKAITIASDYNYPTRADQDTMKNMLAGLFETGLGRNAETTRFAALNGYLTQRAFFAGARRENELALSAARAALDLGLPGRAADLIETVPADRRGTDTQRLSALAYLDDGRYAQAVTATAGASDERVLSLRAEALHRMGRNREAIEIMSAMPQTWDNLDRLARIAWSSGDWDAARDAYAALLVAGQDDEIEARHAVASYMSGQTGAFVAFPDHLDVEALDILISTHADEMKLLREVLAHG